MNCSSCLWDFIHNRINIFFLDSRVLPYLPGKEGTLTNGDFLIKFLFKREKRNLCSVSRASPVFLCLKIIFIPEAYWGWHVLVAYRYPGISKGVIFELKGSDSR